MISFFPDLNVWLALSAAAHTHSKSAWNWLELLPGEAQLIFTRYTQIGLLRILTNRAVMGEQTLTLGKAWDVYDRWLQDPRIEFYPEPGGLDAAFREATSPLAAKAASNSVGDCYLLAYCKACGASLVTFDKGLLELARRQRCPAIVPT